MAMPAIRAFSRSPSLVKLSWQLWSLILAMVALGTDRGMAQVASEVPPSSPVVTAETASSLDLPAEIIEGSPVLQDWIDTSPDIADEILNDPSFPTRLRLGYSQFPSTGQAGGLHVGVEDWFVVPGAGLSVSGDYARSWNGRRQSYGAEARYYLLPLGEYVNLAPVLGYRRLDTPEYTTTGLNLGFRVLLIPSRGGGADIAVSQTWVAPGSQNEVGMTGVSVGYGVTQRLRIATDIQFQNSQFGQDSRLSLSLEYVP